MKSIIAATLILAATAATASDIMLSKSIKSGLRNKIEKDLSIIENFKFSAKTNKETLKTMGLNNLNSATASDWLNNRVNYIVSEKALSLFNLLVRRVVFVDNQDVDFPNPTVIPYSIGNALDATSDADEEGFTVMSNIGTALYFGGKQQRSVYGMKISRGLLRKAEKVAVTSPRTGIIQIGEGLFASEIAVNENNPDAFANSISRIGTFFHEARHSDGNGESLGFFHAKCPAGHDYEGMPACDENLNGPYTIGALIMEEMTKSCGDMCSEKEKQTLKLMAIDSASRVMKTTHKGEASKSWDATPESL